MSACNYLAFMSAHAGAYPAARDLVICCGEYSRDLLTNEVRIDLIVPRYIAFG